MAKAFWAQLAEDELEEIAYYIAVNDRRPETAAKIVTELKDKAQHYADNPATGQRHPDMPDGWLHFIHKRWIVVYQAHNEGILVLRVIDGSRDFNRLFT